MPMIMITGQKGILSSRQARFQIVDIIAAMKPLTKLSRQVVSATMIPTLVREAFRVAEEERPGPVHLELPEDIAAESCDDLPLIPPHPVELPVASPAALDRAAAMIMQAQRPLLMFGAAASRPPLPRRNLRSLSPGLGSPISPRRWAKGRSRQVPNCIWEPPRCRSGDYIHEAIERADLIVTIGHDTIEKPPFIMGTHGPQVIHVGYQSANVEQVYFPQAEVIGDLKLSLRLLADRVEGKLPCAQALQPLRESILRSIADRNDEDRFTPQRLVHDIREVMPQDGIVALDNGMYKIWFARNYRTRMANTLLLDNALATMGAGLPSAIMAAMLYPRRRVMAVCGDGGFMMNSQELETAVRLRLNLVVVVIEDNAYGMIRWKQAVDHFPDFGMTFDNPDFVRYAEAYGARGWRGGAPERHQTDAGACLYRRRGSPGHGANRLLRKRTGVGQGAERAAAGLASGSLMAD